MTATSSSPIGTTPKLAATSPLAWSSNYQKIFATFCDKEFRSFEVSAGSPNCKLLATAPMSPPSPYSSTTNSSLPSWSVSSRSWILRYVSDQPCRLSSRTVNTYGQSPSLRTATILRLDELTEILSFVISTACSQTVWPFPCRYSCLYSPGLLDKSHSASHIDKLCRCLLVKYSKASNLRHRVATTTNHLTLILYDFIICH